MNELRSVQMVGALLDAVTVSRHALEKARDLYEDRLAPDFSPLQFLWRDELTWSKLIGWLLDPTESHAQKGRFLHLFTRHVSHGGREWSEAACNAAVLKLEYSSEFGRIDILIEAEGRLLIIENKPFAVDQAEQLARYYRFAEARTEDRLHTTIVYLTADRKPPSPLSLSPADVEARQADGTLVLQSFPDLASPALPQARAWLDECRLACRSPRVAAFIDDIQKQITADFAGVRDMSESDALVDVMSRHADNIKSAFGVYRNFGRLRETLSLRLIDQLKKKAHPAGIGLLQKGEPEKGLYLNFEIPGLDPFIVRFSASDMVGLGILARDERDSVDPAQIAFGQSLATRLNSLGKSQNWGSKWPWVILPDSHNGLCPLPANLWDNADIWAAIADQDRGVRSGVDVADIIFTAVARVRQAVDDLLQAPAA